MFSLHILRPIIRTVSSQFCDPSLAPSYRDGFNEGSQRMFLLRRKVIFELSPIPLSYLELYLAMLRASDRMRFEDISEFFFYFSMKTCIVTPDWRSLGEMVLMRNHNVCFVQINK